MKIALAICIAAILAVGYNGYSTNSALEDKVAALKQENEKTVASIGKLQAQTTSMASDIEVVGKKLGVTSQELDASRKYAEKLRTDQEQARQQIASELATKASANDVAAVSKDTSAKLAEVQQDANAKIGSVSGDVKAVATKLDATNQDLAASRRDITDVKTTLSAQIARNGSELADLRKKGERDFFEFDIKKDKKESNSEGRRHSDGTEGYRPEASEI